MAAKDDAGRSGEFGLIRRFFAPLAKDQPGALGLTDDAAILGLPPGRRLVVTTDTLVAGVHFRIEDGPERIARKLLRVNLSDLAAMGAYPFAYTLNTAFPVSIDDAWIERFAAALAADQARYRIRLVGGDTVAMPGPLTLTVTAFGQVEEGKEIRRSGAKVGDTLYMSGTIGDAALGLLALNGSLKGISEGEAAALAERYYEPQPRVELGQRLKGVAHAGMDISDGLIADLGHICETSSVGALVEIDRLPLSVAAKRALTAHPDLIETVLAGGDDYELLFTAPVHTEATIPAIARDSRTPISAIGRITEGAGVRVVDGKGREIALKRTGYTHF